MTRAPTETGKPARWMAAELFKALAVVIMFSGHVVVWWFFPDDRTIAEWASEAQRTFLRIYIDLTEFAPVAIPVTAGISLRYVMEPHWDAARNRLTAGDNEIVWRLMKRALLLAIYGFGMNLSAFGWKNAFSWDVLQLVALGIVGIVLCLKWFSMRFVCEFGVFAAFVMPLVRDRLFEEFPSISQRYPVIVLFGDLEGYHYFPVFPWVSYLIFGMALASFRLRRPGDDHLLFRWFFALGAGLLALLTVLDMHHINATLDNIWGPHMFMPTVPELLLGWARFLLVFAVLCWIGDRIKRAPGKWNPVNVFSRGILYIYVFHSILFANLIKYLEPSSGSLPVLALFIAVQLVIAYGIGVLGIRLKRIERLRGILP